MGDMTTLSVPTQHHLSLPKRPLVLLKCPSCAHLQGILTVEYIRSGPEGADMTSTVSLKLGRSYNPAGFTFSTASTEQKQGSIGP